jgi:NADH:ubiquinone oxidoreductase subunit H
MSLPFILLILWVRAALPRMRFDQLLSLGWLEMLPLTIGYMICLPSLL